MKPLELTVYPEGGCETAAHCALKRGCVECVDDVDKRFTDAELAAEHWSYCTGWYAAVRADDDYEGGMWSRELQRRAVILERFATLPHYDDETAS